MIYQRIFKILEMYLNGMETFYHHVDNYFLEKIRKIIKSNQNLEYDFVEALEEIIPFLVDEFVTLGLYRAKVQNRFFDKFITLKIEENDIISSIKDLYEKKIAPLVYEVILEQVIFYLVDERGTPIILYFKNKGLLSIDFIIELKNLKNLFERSPEKLENLRKYIRIRDKIIIKFCENKEQIEKLEDIDDLQNKIQLFYLIYKIIDFFNIQNYFDFSHLIQFLKVHFEDCMEVIPRISLRNPDLCYCALYLGSELKIDYNLKIIKGYLRDSCKDFLHDFDVPILEATNQLYFYLQSTSLVKLWLTDEQINNIVKFDSSEFNILNLESMETSQLANILAIFAFLESLNNPDDQRIKSINYEIETRVTPDGIMQNRNDFYTSEASYYVLLCNYLNNNFEKLKLLSKDNILHNIISKIYRNLELLEFSGDMNADLLSELFYSIESLRLFNCIKLKEFTLLLARCLFPKEIEKKLVKIGNINESKLRARYLKVDRITGESNYIIVN
ncbi:MAG: hypothetical protein ACFFDB_04560 [Promethearchaeota archaeon]